MDIIDVKKELKYHTATICQSQREELYEGYQYWTQDLQREFQFTYQDLAESNFYVMQTIEIYCGFLALLSASGILPQKGEICKSK